MKTIRIIQFSYWISVISAIGFFFWAAGAYISHWDEIMTPKAQFMLQWKPLLGTFLSMISFSTCNELLKRR